MRLTRAFSIAALMIGIAAGTLVDRPRPHPPLTIGGYRVLAADFHTHTSMLSSAALTPWGLVLEAKRRGLDAVAITGHNEALDGKVGRWFSNAIGGPTVLRGEEIRTPAYHLIAAGITETVSFRLSAASAIDEIHRQGGVAIAAHPDPEFWAGYDADAMARLDGAEICHPSIYQRRETQRNYERFAARGRVAAIGSSDFHGLGRIGLCRTYVFAADTTEKAILDAVRAHRTIVFGRDGQAYGDAALIALAAGDPRLRSSEPPDTRGGWLDWISRIAGIAGLAGLLFA